jgi:transcriptional regulator with XRE-family HTH domain
MTHDLQPADLRPRTELAQVTGTLSLLRVRKEAWPYEDFIAFVDARKVVMKIATDAEMARRSGIPSSILSRWRSGQMQPSRDNLRKLAPVLGVAPVALWVAAGLAHPDEMDLSGPVDLTVQPPELLDLMDLYDDARLTDDDRDYMRRTVTTLVSSVRGEIAKRGAPKRPPGAA